MYLKSIEIHGFKSFANKIDFQFHNGITGIVGPNGSGKSNVADAVRWVLGEQSAKQLRGASMQDVIFAGTQSRKPLGYASVAITLDNSDHKLAIDYEEVTITRRVYRSGESEYLINGTVCRLKDVNELFYDTGIGKEGYSIIGQGQIDRILSGKPEERRELFDEAAGIVKFKRRKNAAVKKLQDEQNNLVRVNDILGEMEHQVGPLEKQSEKAKIYLRRKEELKRLEINSFLMEVDRLSEQLSGAKEKQVIAEEELGRANEEFEATREDFDRLQSQLEEIDRVLESKRQEISEADITRQKLLGQVDVLKEQINSSKNTDEHYRSRKEALEKELEEKKAQLSEAVKSKKNIDEMTERAVEDRDNARESQQAISASIQHLQNSIEKGQQNIVEAINHRTDINTRLGQCDTMLEQIEIRKAELNSRLLKAKSVEQQLASRTKENEEIFKKICAEINSLEEQIAESESEIGQLTEEIRANEKLVLETREKYHSVNSRLESLKNIAERYEGYGNSIRRVMEKKDKSVNGVVADIIKVDKKYETAIETALGGNIQNIVTEDEATAKRMIEFLKENRIGRATFLPLTAVREREFNAPDALKEKGVIGLADTLVTCEDKYQIIANNLLHNYIVVDHIDNALALAKKFKYTLRCVTLAGEALNPGGSISGGTFKNNSNFLGRGREMEELEEKVKQLRDEIAGLNEKNEKLRASRQKKREENSALHEQQQVKFIEQNTAKLNLSQVKSQQEETRKGYDSLHSEENDIIEQIAQMQSQKKMIAGELTTSQKNESDTQRKLEEQTKLLEERRSRESDLLASLSDLDIKAAELLQKQEFESQNVERIEGEKARLLDELNQINEQLAGSEKLTSEKYENIEKLEATIKASEKAGSEGRSIVEEKLAEKEEIARKQKDFVQMREVLSGKRSDLEKEVYRLNGQLEKLQETSESRYSYMWNEYEITMSQAKEMRDPELTDLSAMKREIVSIRGSIRELGDVNVNAIEDYKNLMERYTFLKTQHDDLEKAKADLEKVIEELDEGMRKQFSEKFKEIAAQFDKVFREMFGGGKGTLELMEDEDILEAGIRIIAQPPGKKLQNMMQLSGGEKALTAIALLFAIQNLKPSPFCLLDEIEAALDESNVERFAGYLAKLTKHTQFIVITHRRGTMEKADRLYGITMQEKGISALVSVNMIDDKDIK